MLMSAFLAVDYFKPALFIREIVLIIICLSVSLLIFNYYKVTIKEKAKTLNAANIVMKKSTISVLTNIIVYFIVHPIFILLLYFVINKYGHPISFDHPIIFGAVFALIIVNGSKAFAETYFTNKYGEL